MRGRIVFYNALDGKGLIAADQQQYPFEIAQWQSDTAPALNVVVEFEVENDRPIRVRRVSEDVLLREKGKELAGKVGAFASGALQSAQQNTKSGQMRKPELIFQALFALSALFLPFFRTYVEFGTIRAYGRAFSLTNLAELHDPWDGSHAGSTVWPWLAILSLLVPACWANRFAWFALFLPLWSVLLPMVGLSGRLAHMSESGFGAVVCGLSAIALAVIAVVRFRQASPAQHDP
jgi:hypothetical protein